MFIGEEWNFISSCEQPEQIFAGKHASIIICGLYKNYIVIR